MSERVIPFDPDAICDICGAVGAFDFMGDFYCEGCLRDAMDDYEEDFDDRDAIEF